MGRLDGSVALITGGARGQGAAEGRLFAEEGAAVVLTDLREEDGQAAAAAIGDAATFLRHDVTSEQGWGEVVSAVLERHARIDVLVNNAGIMLSAPLLATSLDDYLRVISVNQVGVFLGMQAVAGPMQEAGGGSIVNISSVSGLRGSPNQIAYAASKWAVRGMTKVAARELAPYGIRVNSIHPGVIDTPMLEDANFDDEQWEALRGRVPVGAFADADAVARLALYLASSDSSYSTGSEFIVDGGLTA